MNINIEQIFGNDKAEFADKEEFLKYLYNNKSDNIYHIDRFPMLIKNTDKFDQMNMLYQEVLGSKNAKKVFLDIEVKYRNFMNKLWIYNDVLVDFLKPSGLYAPLSKIVEKKYKKYLNILENKNHNGKMFKFTEKNELEFWVQVAMRDAIDVTFYLKNYQIIIIPNYDFIFDIYLNDKEHYQIIRDIAISEGLFLRK